MFEGLKVTGHRSVKNSKLKCFLSVHFPEIGLDVHDLTLFQDNGRRWFNLPSREYLDRETNEKKWVNTMRFPDEAVYKQFMTALESAFNDYCKLIEVQNKTPQQELKLQEPEYKDEDLPF